MILKVKLDNNAIMPKKAHSSDAGFDLFSRNTQNIPAKGCTSFDTGVHIQIPEGMTGFLKSKSGLNVNHCIQSEGVIDSGYTGSIIVKLYNHSDTDYLVNEGDKITQLVMLPIPPIELIEADFSNDTQRGNNGFGSSGK